MIKRMFLLFAALCLVVGVTSSGFAQQTDTSSTIQKEGTVKTKHKSGKKKEKVKKVKKKTDKKTEKKHKRNKHAADKQATDQQTTTDTSK